MSHFENVRQILVSTLQIEHRAREMTPDTPLLGNIAELDSMAVVTILTEVEEQYGIVIEDDEIGAEVFETLGSLVSLTAAANYPEMAQGLILINLPDTAARSELVPRPLRKILTQVESLFAAPLLWRTLFPLLRSPSVIRRWAKIAYPNVSNLDDELVDILCTPPRDEYAHDAFVALIQSALHSSFAPPVKQLLPQLDIPILLLWGERDQMIPPRLAQTFVDLNSNLKLVMLPNLGHCPHDESPEEFHQVVLPWLKSINN